jgi:hypothetical protein
MTQQAGGYEDCGIRLESGRLRVRRCGAADAPAVVLRACRRTCAASMTCAQLEPSMKEMKESMKEMKEETE